MSGHVKLVVLLFLEPRLRAKPTLIQFPSRSFIRSFWGGLDSPQTRNFCWLAVPDVVVAVVPCFRRRIYLLKHVDRNFVES
jgi:hypothetical protein